MSKPRTKRELTLYFVITMIVTWTLWMPAVFDSNGRDVPSVLLIVSLMASFTPSIVGLSLERRFRGGASFKEELRTRLSLNFAKRWLLAIPVFFFATAGLSYGLMLLFLPNFEPIRPLSWQMAPLVFLQILFIGGALGEEFGWRGFALPRLLQQTSPLRATLLLGVVWSFWHIPLFFMSGTVQSNIPIWQFLLQNTLLAFYYTWLYMKTRGNLVLMIYLHAIANTAAALFPYWQTDVGRWIGFALLALGCILLYTLHPIQTKEHMASPSD